MAKPIEVPSNETSVTTQPGRLEGWVLSSKGVASVKLYDNGKGKAEGTLIEIKFREEETREFSCNIVIENGIFYKVSGEVSGVILGDFE